MTKCVSNGSAPPEEASSALIKEILKETDTLWGTVLPYHASVSRTKETENLPLWEAVARIEAAQEPDRFLVVAYQDGGVTSVSGTRFPFQADARPAEWWEPYRKRSWRELFTLGWGKRDD